MKILCIPTACLIACLGACSTSKVALEHANNGVALTAGLQRELTRYDEAQKTVDQLRRQVIIEETLQAKRYFRDNESDDARALLTGDKSRLAAYSQMRQAAEIRAKLVADTAADEKEVQGAMASLMNPMAPPLPKIAAAQKTLAELAQDLTLDERLKLVTKFVEEVRAEVKSSREAVDAVAPK